MFYLGLGRVHGSLNLISDKKWRKKREKGKLPRNSFKVVRLDLQKMRGKGGRGGKEAGKGLKSEGPIVHLDFVGHSTFYRRITSVIDGFIASTLAITGLCSSLAMTSRNYSDSRALLGTLLRTRHAELPCYRRKRVLFET